MVENVREKERRRSKSMLSGEVYTVSMLRSLFQRHSPGGATVLLCLICYAIHRVVDRESGMRLSWGLVGGVREMGKRIQRGTKSGY